MAEPERLPMDGFKSVDVILGAGFPVYKRKKNVYVTVTLQDRSL